MLVFDREILGHLPSMKNGRVFIIERRQSISPKADEYKDTFMRQVGAARTPYEGPVLLVTHIHYGHKASDLDPALLMDCLQKSNVLKNDNQVVGAITWKDLDRERPRLRVKLLGGDEAQMLAWKQGVLGFWLASP